MAYSVSRVPLGAGVVVFASGTGQEPLRARTESASELLGEHSSARVSSPRALCSVLRASDALCVIGGQRTPFKVASSNFTSRVAAHTSATKAFSTDYTHSSKPLTAARAFTLAERQHRCIVNEQPGLGLCTKFDDKPGTLG